MRNLNSLQLEELDILSKIEINGGSDTTAGDIAEGAGRVVGTLAAGVLLVAYSLVKVVPKLL